MTKKQKDVFLNGEADQWFARNNTQNNSSCRAEEDPVISMLLTTDIAPRNIIEIGAGNGWRLEALREQYIGSNCIGIEPSEAAIVDCMKSFPNVTMHLGTADNLPIDDGFADLIILGFCLYLCDRTDLFQIAAECDRILSEGGYLLIYDFNNEIPHRNPYSHKHGVYSYKMDYSKMFLWNPVYRLQSHMVTDHDKKTGLDPNDRIGVTLLVKDSSDSYIDNPYSINGIKN